MTEENIREVRQLKKDVAKLAHMAVETKSPQVKDAYEMAMQEKLDKIQGLELIG